MLLFIVFDNGAAKTPAANLTIFGGILPKPEVFLALTSLSSFLTSSIVVYGWYRRYMLVLKIFLNLLKTWMIFKILFCYLYNNPFVFNIVVTCDMSWCFTWRFFKYINSVNIINIAMLIILTQHHWSVPWQSQLFQTDEAFTVDGHKHANPNTRAHTHTQASK